MALRLPFTPPNDETIASAYCRPLRFSHDETKGRESTTVQMGVWRNRAASDAGRPPLAAMDFTFADTPAVAEVTRDVEKTQPDGTKATVKEVVTKAVPAGTRKTRFEENMKTMDRKKAAYSLLKADHSGPGKEFAAATDDV